MRVEIATVVPLRIVPRWAVPIVLAVIMVASAALSLIWTTAVPVFQSPDEPAHFDYAYAIAASGHLLRAADSHSPGDAPAVDTLARQAGLGEMAFRPDRRAPSNYYSAGWLEIVEHVSTAAPVGLYSGVAPLRPWLNVVYPPGYYALTALVMRIGGFLHEDIFSAFMTARRLSIALMVIGLGGWFLAMRATRLSALSSTLLTGVVGLAPLTSFVSSYVQPDNLAFALCGFAIYAAVRARTRAASIAPLLFYGGMLGLLWFTKYQFALIVTLATLPSVLPALARQPIGGSKKVLALLGIALPSAVAIAVTTWCTTGYAGGYFGGQRTLTTATSLAFAHGLRAGIAYLATWTHRAWVDFFTSIGTVHVSFWGDFGWLDTPLTSGDIGTDTFIGRALGWGTTLTLVFATAAVVRNSIRLANVGRRRGWSTALAVASADPIPLVYYGFVAMLFALYVLSSNLFGAQGRDFYPLETAAFLTTVRYAPKALPWRKGRALVAGIAGVSLLAFVFVSGRYAIDSVLDRYYAPLQVSANSAPITHLPKSDVVPGGSVDDAVWILGSARVPLGSAPMHPAASILVRGWAMDPRFPARPPASVELRLDGRVYANRTTLFNRPDVAQVLRNPDLLYSGYQFEIPPNTLRPGRHRLSLEFTTRDHGARMQSVALPPFEVTR